MFRARLAIGVAMATLASLTSFVAVGTPAAQATQAPATQPTLVSATPGTNTPNVQDGTVFAIARVGSKVFLGGSFTQVKSHGSSTVLTRNYVLAYDAATGVVDTGFVPTVTAEVDAILPGPIANSVYIAGKFASVNGKNMKVALVDTRTGALISTWKNPALNGVVQDLDLANGKLFLAGFFTMAGGVSHGGLVAVDPTTGTVDNNYFTMSFTGHHNYGVNCDPSTSKCANASVGLRKIDADPSGTHLVAIGNFNTAGGLPRDQVALLDLTPTGGTVDPNWSTQAFTAKCFANAYDFYVRGLQFSPDGSYFVIASTGGSGSNKDGTNSSCDTAARFNTADTGANVRPAWLDYTGQDTALSVAITGTVVYVGGHERWYNNSKGYDRAGEGAVPRPGIVALDPQNGMPFSWNPGRNPRGAGAYALLATSDGLYVGSDTDWIGNFQYERQKIAFFPLAGGEALPDNFAGALPNVYVAGPKTGNSTYGDTLAHRNFDGTTLSGTDTPVVTPVAWGSTRGAFMVDGTLYYGKTSDYRLYARTFDGATFGPETLVDPYHDPVWDGVDTGSGNTYDGMFPDMFTSTTMGTITSLFYDQGRIYFTQSSQSAMHYRYFEPESGIVGSDTFTVNDGQNWSNVTGAFLANGTLYFANKTTGALYKTPWANDHGMSSAGTLVDSNHNWAARALFLYAANIPPNQPPTASFTSSCSTTGTSCTFNAGASTDSDGTIVDYAWTFAGGTPVHLATATTSHDFGNPGSYTVSLTVKDDDGATATTSKVVTVGSAAPAAFRAAASGAGNTASRTVTIPASVQSGDALLLFVTWGSSGTSGVTSTVPAGWTELGSGELSSTLETDVYTRTATATDSGSDVQVTFSGTTHNTVTVAAYSGIGSPIVNQSAALAHASTASHTTPTITVPSPGGLVLSFWSDRSSSTTAWTAPPGVTTRQASYDTGGGRVTSLLADSGSVQPAGSYGGLTATTDAASGRDTTWTISLTPAN